MWGKPEAARAKTQVKGRVPPALPRELFRAPPVCAQCGCSGERASGPRRTLRHLRLDGRTHDTHVCVRPKRPDSNRRTRARVARSPRLAGSVNGWARTTRQESREQAKRRREGGEEGHRKGCSRGCASRRLATGMQNANMDPSSVAEFMFVYFFVEGPRLPLAGGATFGFAPQSDRGDLDAPARIIYKIIQITHTRFLSKLRCYL